MDNNDNRDYAEEEYNRAEMEREAAEELAEERKTRLLLLYRRILTNTIEAAKVWEKSTQATLDGKDGIAKSYAQKWANMVAETKVTETEFRRLADF